MRYRLRTLLIVLALGPPLLACLWWNRDGFILETIAAWPFWGFVVGMIAVLIDVVPSLFRKWGP